VTVGITFALFGCVLVYTAAIPLLQGRANEALLLTSLGKIAHLLEEHQRNLVLLTSAFFIVGFGTKAGLVPFHAWLPDAHAEAPAPISALLSGIVIKVGAYALARTLTMFTGYPAVVVFVAILASVSMLVGMGMAFVQDDLKRMLAYSSVAQIAYVIEGLGVGSYLGIYGGLFHLLNHTIIKALLFLSVGAVMYATGTRKISQLAGLSRTMPVTAFCFLVGALAIGGMPPMNGFWSKFTLFVAVGQRGLLWAAVIGVITGMMSVACFVLAAYRVFWGEYRAPAFAAANPHAKEVPVSMWIGMVALAGLCLVIGVYPRLVHPLIHSATECILSILGAG
jgi:formate hydrogenlyase subunit 3/multisubunit Na+/H+ antiporter MnhD subunit